MSAGNVGVDRDDERLAVNHCGRGLVAVSGSHQERFAAIAGRGVRRVSVNCYDQPSVYDFDFHVCFSFFGLLFVLPGLCPGGDTVTAG